MNDTPDLTLADVEATAQAIAPYATVTPTVRWRGPTVDAALGTETAVFLKLEILQAAGSFKLRGALSSMLRLSPEQRAHGVTAMSSGNHAIAVSYAAAQLGIDARVVMQDTANPMRVALARSFGATVEIAPAGEATFKRAEALVREEHRVLVHPFEGRPVALGTATVGLELARQVPDLDAVIVAIGGGGLAAGLAPIIKQLQPKVRVIGVEPEGADVMHRSFAAGEPVRMDQMHTIADSLAPPFTLPHTFALCRHYVDQLVRIDDESMRRAMAALYREARLVTEPAAAAATAALLGPLREQLRGQRVAVMVCGANIDLDSFGTLVRPYL